MATGLQYKENLTLISGGYTGEGIGSNGQHQDWTDAETLSGFNAVEYYYHDSSQSFDGNSTQVNVLISDNWSASIDSRNVITVTVSSILEMITRQVVGSPSAYSVSMFVKRTADGPVKWSSGGCVNAAVAASYISTPVDLGSTTITLNPGDSTNVQGSVYYRSNACGHDSDTPPSAYVDEFWMGINFRNTLPVAPTYTLHYDANGGSGAPGDQSLQTNAGSATFTVSSTQPTWGDFIFLGWSTQQIDEGQPSDVEYRAGDSLTISGSSSKTVTLYAVWEKNYRPGKTYNGSNTWLSHNRNSGWAGIWDGNNFKEMRTEGNGSLDDNPPLIKYSDAWRTQRKIGQE